MKKLNIIARNHMDPSWLRCFTDHFNHPVSGDVIRPYADVEELQILEYMDFAEKYGVKYQIEQSLVVRKFLERNPDQKERFKDLVKKGLLELAGGGETVIDRNLTQGESWARNHLYSCKYYEEEFQYKPRYAITPDIFGLPSQLPQFFRSLGYDALIVFDRVLKDNKPFWQGLDGTKIVLDSKFLQPPEPVMRTADCVKIGACSACHGEGCELCEGTGIDTTYNMTRPDKKEFKEGYYGNMSAEELLEKLLETDREEYFVMIVTEEPRIGNYLYGQLNEAAPKYGVEVNYLTFEENHDVWCKGQVEALRNGSFSEDEIDKRPEGNPAGCGCYSSRIEIKKANRELENLLLEAEKLCVLAKFHGGWDVNALPRRDYPVRKLQDLWSKMAFIQFHDNLPGSHCDASYDEVLRYIREVRRGAEQIYQDASLECMRRICPDIPEGFQAAVFFNTETCAVEFPRLTLHAPENTQSIEVYDTEGTRLSAFDTEVTPALVGCGVKITVHATVPPMGYKVFLWRASEAAEKTEAVSADKLLQIENEYYIVTVEGNRITGIYDKKNGRQAVAQGAGLAISEDKGSPWGRNEPETGYMELTADSIKCEMAEGFSRLILTGKFADEGRRIKELSWTQTVTLYQGEPLIRWHNDIDWDGTDTRIFASFPIAFEHRDKLVCEVPFGTMERTEPELIQCLGLTDEWPSLGFAGVTDNHYNLAVLKGGFPASKLHDGILRISLLRAFAYENPTYSGTNDIGCHSSDYALTIWTGDFAEGCCSQRAALFNMHGHTQEISESVYEERVHGERAEEKGEACLFPALTRIPAALRLSALKWSEDGKDVVVRFWESTGKSVTIQLPEGVKILSCNTLEEPQTHVLVSEYTFHPFEIATFRMVFREKEEESAQAKEVGREDEV